MKKNLLNKTKQSKSELKDKYGQYMCQIKMNKL